MSYDSALLARLTAGRLAASSRRHEVDEVLLDGFALAGNNATLRSYKALFAALTRVVDGMQELARDVAPVRAEAVVHQARAKALEEQAAAEGLSDADADEYRDAAEELYARFAARSGAAEPGEKLLEICVETVTLSAPR